MSRFRVVVGGGGIAAAEGVLRMRRLVGDTVDITIIAPNEELVYRPLAVKEPFAAGGVRRYPLRRLASHTDAELLQDSLERVELDGQVAHTTGGRAFEWDALLVAVGGRPEAPMAHAEVFSDLATEFHGLIQDIEGGYSKSVAFLAPDGPTWPLPLYELALMTSERARSMGMDDVRMWLATPEPEPLAVFGDGASRVVAALLADAGIDVRTSVTADVPASRRVLLHPSEEELPAERIVTLPRLRGPALRGIPDATADGFLPIEPGCEVRGTGGRVFAAGDVVDFPVKHGGLGARMADTAAANIARLAGAESEPAVLHPVIQGTLLTGRETLYLSAHVHEGRGLDSQVDREPPWPIDEKIVAEELGPWLAGLDAERRA